MTALEPVVLAGRHVRLLPLGLEHAPHLVAAANASRRTFAFTYVPEDLSAMERYIASALADREAGRALPFCVEDAAGSVVGSTRFVDIERWDWFGLAPSAATRSGIDALEIGFTWYAERVQRTALNTEAKILLCDHAFGTLGVRRVTWKTDARNVRSQNAILRLGATFDGCLRAHRAAPDGTVRDTMVYSMLAAEWPSARAALVDRLALPFTAPRAAG